MTHAPTHNLAGRRTRVFVSGPLVTRHAALFTAESAVLSPGQDVAVGDAATLIGTTAAPR
jgi:hypothetical protein